MYCEKCGTELSSNDAFCGTCGATTPAESQNQVLSDTPIENTTKQPKRAKQPKQSKSKKPLIISLCAVAVVLIAAAFGFCVRLSSSY